MCGIYGITSWDPYYISNFINWCRHRGPDGEQVWEDPLKQVTFGHNLLSIMSDPKLSLQPWHTPAGNTLVYNGEIFNYYELKEKYRSQGFVDTTGTDTELLAWGLDTHGLKFIEEIDSMHGFAYYKPKIQELWLSRDHAGIKPLFYAQIKEGLVFGSEIKGMIDKVPGCQKIDKMSVSFMQRTGINALSHTFFSGIKKMLPGETIVWDIPTKRIKSKHRQYIKCSNTRTFNPEEFRQEANKTVKMCSIGQRKIGVFLSGGLDSSLVAYELNKIKGKVNSFTNKMYPSVVSDEDYNEDARCAEILAKQNNFNHTEIKITPENFMNSWDDSIYFMEQPIYNPSMSMYCYTNKFISDKEIIVTLAGDMGDEILAGYPKYWKMKNPEWLSKQIGKTKLESWDDVLRLWLKRIKRPLRLTESSYSDEVVIEEFRKCFSDELWNPDDPIGSYMALDCVAQVPEEMFNRNDKYGMAYGMEGRFPLATKSFMKYCMSMHTNIKMGSDKSDTKILTKKAYNGLLPNEIINKGKTGWTVPIGIWLTTNVDEKLKKFYNDAMQDKSKLDMIKASQKAGKALVPAWIVNDWIKKYEMSF
jgi:asparagine synthase (glutamine-hydrolysing)